MPEERENSVATKAGGVQKTAAKDMSTFNPGRFDDDALRNINSVEDAIKLAGQMYGQVDSIEDLELGNGFVLLGDNKDRLVGVPFLILTSEFHLGDYGEFASMLLVTMDGSNARVIMNDGSTGICEQLKEMTKKAGRAGGFTVPKGLRKSEYTTCPKCSLPLKRGVTKHEPGCGAVVGEQERGKGSTYYFEISA